MYFLLPVIVVVASFIAISIWSAFGGEVFYDDIIMTIAYLLMIALLWAYCIAKYIQMIKRKEVYTLFDKIVASMMCTITVNISFFSLGEIGSGNMALFVVIFGWVIPPTSFIICYCWLKKNDKIARARERMSDTM